MATNYKIRLRRFNGLDYDTLNLSSENIIRNNGNTVEQEFNNIIPSSNGILKNNNGIFNIATLGTDYTAVDDSLISSDTKTYSINKQKNTFSTFDMLGIVIDGNSTPVGASAGQYVIVKDSTISGITDGLYTAAQAIPANTAIDATYLNNKVDDGGLNDALSRSKWHLLWQNPNPLTSFSAQTTTVNYSAFQRLIFFYNLTSNNYRQLMTGIDVTTTGGMLMRTTVGDSTVYLASRGFDLVGGNQISYQDCSYCLIDTQGLIFRTDNTICIPFAVYGVEK